MTLETFTDLWTKYSSDWHQTAKVMVNGQKVSVSKLCSLRDDYCPTLHKIYETIKKTVKRFYFFQSDKLLNRYKRAAVIVYTINASAPVIYCGKDFYRLDRYYLKQRLAFFVALGSILQEYDTNQINHKCEAAGKLLFIPARTTLERDAGADNFLESIYKDLFFAELYQNYNVLTMANMFQLLIERASVLSDLNPLSDDVNPKSEA